MRPFWHPLSALYLAEPRAYASTVLVKMLLRSGEPVDLLCGGDRMWPASEQPQRVRLEACDPGRLVAGEVVVAVEAGIPDLLRVVGGSAEEGWLLRGDADAGEARRVPPEAVLGRVPVARRSLGRWSRGLRRVAVDLGEAWRGSLPPEGEADGRGESDPARSVLEKYDAQAPFYVDNDGPEIEPTLLELARAGIAPESRVLVIGCGSGRESFALARCGYRVRGIDFSPAMIEHARRGAAERGLEIEFVEADVRRHEEAAESLGGILFTNDVYSFLPGPAARADLLRRMATWLAPGGVVLLSARIVRRAYERWVLTLQWLRCARGTGGGWGDSHTRYLAPDGTLRRSYVHYFTPRRLRHEAEGAGWRLDRWTGGHVELRRDTADSPLQRAPAPAGR